MKLALNPVDQYVGSRLREMRERMQLTQAFVATTVGTTIEQIELYERGLERVGAERLVKFARAFSVSAAYFFKQGKSQPSEEREPRFEQRWPFVGSENVFGLQGRNEANHSSYLKEQCPEPKKKESN